MTNGFKPMRTLMELQDNYAKTGKLEWIGLRPGYRREMIVVSEAELLTGKGLSGDHYDNHSGNGKRQVTLIQAEHIPVIAALCGLKRIEPDRLRRNLVVSGINIASLKNRNFRLGTAILRGTGYCHPCSRMEETLGQGGYNAMRNHGGITALVISGGRITTGDHIEILPETG